MNRDQRGGLWLPGAGSGGLDLQDASTLHKAILDVAKLSEQDAMQVVSHLIEAGQYYEAARCLEIVAQDRLGLEAPADAVLNPGMKGFGAFHATILLLLQSGALYGRARRPRTADTVMRRTLIFVEESLRSVDHVRTGRQDDLWSLGVTFELAGHVCVAIGDLAGLEYYSAAHEYWRRAVDLEPGRLPGLAAHPVTRTVISCLEPVAETRQLDDDYREVLRSPDFETRIDTARSLLR